MRIAFPFACSTSSRMGARTRVSAMPASSTTRTEPAGRPPLARASSSSRWSVVAEMPVSSWSFSAATPDGAAPSTSMPACAKTWPTAWVAVVFPAPARPTTQTTRLGLVAASRTIVSCSSESASLSARSISSSRSVGDRGRAGVAPALDERERLTLDVDELGRGVAGRTARARRFTDRLNTIGAGEAGREPAHPLGGGAGAVCLRPGHHGFGVGERGLLLGQTLRAEHPACDAQQLFARRLLVGDPAEKPGELAGAEAVLGGPRAPILAQSGQVDVLFPFAGLERSDLGGVEALLSAARELLDDLRCGGSRTRGSPRAGRA